MEDGRDPLLRHITQYLRLHPPQSAYVLRYDALMTDTDRTELVLQLALALLHHCPIYLLMHYDAIVPPGLHALATATETWGLDGDDETDAATRLLQRVTRDAHHERL